MGQEEFQAAQKIKESVSQAKRKFLSQSHPQEEPSTPLERPAFVVPP